MRIVLVLLMALAGIVPAAAQRIELPVRFVELSDGARRFGVTMTIDGRQVEAGLDTGSTGLRVMARALPGEDAGPRVHYGYGSGTQLDGNVSTATIGFGALTGSVKLQRVDHLSCLPRRPDCPVSRNADPATFGIQGDGLPGQGFAAILGINFRSANVPNPFEALGVRRWIVDLPRPGDHGPGRIILNPTDAELTGYARYRLLDDDNSVAACLSGPPPLGQVCAPATIDSGAPGIFVFDSAMRPPPRGSIPLILAIGDAKQQSLAHLDSDRREQASKLIVAPLADAGAPSMHLGIAPYWIWSVFYDADAHVIGLKPR